MIVGIPIVLVVGTGIRPLLLSLPRRIGFLFVAAGTVFVSGAIGMEMVGGAVYDRDGWASPRYQAIIHLEESMEMIGVILFVYSSRFGHRPAGVAALRASTEGLMAPPPGGLLTGVTLNRA